MMGKMMIRQQQQQQQQQQEQRDKKWRQSRPVSIDGYIRNKQDMLFFESS